MISFRVSEDELARLRAVSENYGARSVSDYAREALSCNGAVVDPKIDNQLQQLTRDVQQLGHAITSLIDMVRDKSNGDHSKNAPGHYFNSNVNPQIGLEEE